MSGNLESTTCVICGGDQLERLVSAVGERRYCVSCFHGWRTEVPEYSYEAVAMCSLGTSDSRLASQIRCFAPFAPASARVLEIGCATGELAAAVRGTLDIGRYDAIELSPAAIQAERHLDTLYRRPLRSLLELGEISPGYDLVLMSHVLEHLEAPVAEIAAIRKVLAPGGALFIEVPNRAGCAALPIDDNRSHIHFFSPTSLMRLLGAERLEVVASESGAWLDARYSDSLRVVARPFNVPSWRPGFLSDAPALEGREKIVVWGAGSLAEEVLANFFDRRRIDFFIDKNPEKQGALCLGRPVLPPDSLGSAPRTVLLNSIDFADAIAADIARLYPDVPHELIAIADLLDGRSAQGER